MVITITQQSSNAITETTLLLQPSPEDNRKLVQQPLPNLVYESTRTPNDIPRYKIKTRAWKELTQEEIENFFEESFTTQLIREAVDNGSLDFDYEDEMREEIQCQRHTTIPKAIIFAVLQGLHASRPTPQKFVLYGKKWTPEYVRKAVQVVLTKLNTESITATGKSVTFTYDF